MRFFAALIACLAQAQSGDGWETLGSASISPDGQWVCYEVRRAGATSEWRRAAVFGGEIESCAPCIASPVSASANVSPGGRFELTFRDGRYRACELASGKCRTIGRGARTVFPRMDVAGWTPGDASVIVHDDLDVWELPLNGARPRRLTNGKRDAIRRRLVAIEGPVADLSKPQYLHLFGTWSKREGIARMAGGKIERLVWIEARVTRISKARDAGVFFYAAESADDAPDIFAGSDFRTARQITDINPLQKRHRWGASELIEYRGPRGERLQAVLRFPDGFEHGKRYPVVVQPGEHSSDELHHYTPPQKRGAYFVLKPDVVPRADPLEYVAAAMRKALEAGPIDTAQLSEDLTRLLGN